MSAVIPAGEEERVPGLEVDGEMHGDAALSESIRNRVHPDSAFKGEANLLIMPNLDAANISFNLLKLTGGEGVTIGPILLGANRPAQNPRMRDLRSARPVLSCRDRHDTPN